MMALATVKNLRRVWRFGIAFLMAYVMWQVQVGHEAQRHVKVLQEKIAQIEADTERRKVHFAKEIARMNSELEASKRTEELIDEARRDPDAARPAVGVRSVNRINRDR